MNVFDQLAGFAFCMIRPAVALSLVPFANDGALGTALRVPLVLVFAALGAAGGLPTHWLPAAASEALAGALLGLSLGVVFHAAAAAGAILDQQSGYSIGAVYDPNFQQESSQFETLFTQFAALTFFTGNGLIAVCGFFVDAWALWPPGAAPQDALAHSLRALAFARLPESFAQGLQLAAPLLALMLCVDAALGLASRHAKRLNPFSTARALKVMVLSFAAMSCVPAILGRLMRIMMNALNLG